MLQVDKLKGNSENKLDYSGDGDWFELEGYVQSLSFPNFSEIQGVNTALSFDKEDFPEKRS